MLSDRWKVLSPEKACEEIIRLRALPELDRKLELMCHPLAVVVEDLLWQYVEVLNAPEGCGGRFAAISSMGGSESGLVEVTLMNGVWTWAVYLGGSRLSESGEAPDMKASMRACASALQRRLGEGAVAGRRRMPAFAPARLATTASPGAPGAP